MNMVEIQLINSEPHEEYRITLTTKHTVRPLIFFGPKVVKETVRTFRGSDVTWYDEETGNYASTNTNQFLSAQFRLYKWLKEQNEKV